MTLCSNPMKCLELPGNHSLKTDCRTRNQADKHDRDD